jgi:hypothetical protein
VLGVLGHIVAGMKKLLSKNLSQLARLDYSHCKSRSISLYYHIGRAYRRKLQELEIGLREKPVGHAVMISAEMQVINAVWSVICSRGIEEESQHNKAAVLWILWACRTCYLSIESSGMANNLLRGDDDDLHYVCSFLGVSVHAERARREKLEACCVLLGGVVQWQATIEDVASGVMPCQFGQDR